MNTKYRCPQINFNQVPELTQTCRDIAAKQVVNEVTLNTRVQSYPPGGVTFNAIL